MLTLDTLDRRTPAAGPLAPLNVAAYAAWVATGVSGLLGHFWRLQPISEVQWTVGMAASFLFLLTFSARAILDERNASDRALGIAIGLQAAFAPLCLWMMQDNLQAVLLVLVAAQLPLLRERRLALVALALANCVLFVWLTRSQSAVKALQLSVAYVAFEFFAAFAMRAACIAQESRREAVRANSELRAARALVAEGARAQERLRVSRELHDVAGHKLTALKLQLSLEMRTRTTREPGTLPQCLALADELLTDIRRVVSSLRQEDTIDLRNALFALDPAVASISVRFNLEPDAEISDIGKAETLLRCAQEGLTNALRHGGATEIVVTLARREADLVLSVEDNGSGYQSSAPPMGNGLRGLRERLEEFQGAVFLDRRTPRGCVLRAVLPGPRPAC